MIRNFAFSAIFSLISSLAFSGEMAYACKVIHIYKVNPNGSLTTNSDSALEKLVKQNAFSVSRETGALTGNSSGLDTSLAKNTRVINRGSSEKSFMATSDFGLFGSGNHPFQLLEIEEFSKAEQKPFVLKGINGIFTGLCK